MTQEQAGPQKRYTYACSRCGSENVRRDAWAAWDVEGQSWELTSVFDAGFCEDCEREETIAAVEIPEGLAWPIP